MNNQKSGIIHTIIKVLTSAVFLIFIQFIASVLLTIFVYNLQMLPLKIMMIFGGILLVLWILISFILLKLRKTKHKKARIGCKIISVLMSILLIIASCMAVRGNDFISNITGGNPFVTYSVDIYVKEDSGYDSLSDLKDKKIAIDYEKESARLVEAINAASDEMGTSIDNQLVEETSFEDMADALYNGDVDAIICCEELAVLMEAKHKDFDTQCISIWSYSVKGKSNYKTDSVSSITKEPFAVYVTGIDTYGEVNTVSRSDVNLVVVVNPKTKQILMISIPRDTQITLHSKQAMDKLTHTGIYGTDETITTIEDFLDMNINYYMRTNFTGLINIVNTLGGVTVDSPYDFDCTIKVDHQVFHVNKGINKLNGKQALSFVRERKHLPNGDYDRGRDQQILLQAMIEKCMTPSIIVKYNQLLKDVEDCFETDMTSDELRSLANMQLNDMSSWNFKSVQISGTNSDTDQTYSMYGTKCFIMIPDETKKQQIESLIDKVENGEVLTDSDVEGLK